MKDNYTHITLILDRSGSMMNVRDDVIGGINKFLQEQREQPGECTLTLVQFDDEAPYDVLVDFRPIKEVPDIGQEYMPRGWTPLFDAVGKGIVDLGKRLEQLPEAQRPGKVIFVTMTDGQENASKEFTAEAVKKLTEQQEQQYNWQFMYLGSKHDVAQQASSIGVRLNSAASYSEQKTNGGILLASKKMSAYRSSGNSADLQWSAEDRRQLQ